MLHLCFCCSSLVELAECTRLVYSPVFSPGLMIHVLIHVSRLTLPSFPVLDNQSIVCLLLSLPLFCTLTLICLHSLFCTFFHFCPCFIFCLLKFFGLERHNNRLSVISHRIYSCNFSNLASNLLKMLQGFSIHAAALCPPLLHD